jgi:hypothetical protein
MILYLFGSYFNPLTITTITPHGDNVRIWFNADWYLVVNNAKVYDVASMINEAIKEFNK